MNFYLLLHDKKFLAAQLASIYRHHPDATCIAIQPAGSLVPLPIPAVRSMPGKSVFMILSAIRSLPDGAAVFLEWDMVLTEPLREGNAINKEPDDRFGPLYPSFLSWAKKGDFKPGFLAGQTAVPFSADWIAVQQRWIDDGCGSGMNFRRLDNGILHFHNLAGFRAVAGTTDERLECWNTMMDAVGLPHAGVEVDPRVLNRQTIDAAALLTPDGMTLAQPEPPEKNAETPQRMGLGDMVASGLSAVGITKERVSQIVGRDCGCRKRQQALNELGKKFGIG